MTIMISRTADCFRGAKEGTAEVGGLNPLPVLSFPCRVRSQSVSRYSSGDHIVLLVSPKAPQCTSAIPYNDRGVHCFAGWRPDVEKLRASTKLTEP